MIIGLVSNWGAERCGVQNFGRDWARALEDAGYDVPRLSWEFPAWCDQLLVNWDSGTLPPDGLPSRATVFVHHTYRGTPDVHPRQILSPIKGGGTYYPYPIPACAPSTPIQPRTIGVTTLRQEGVDYLQRAAVQIGATLCLPDRWRDTPEEVARLASCAVLAAWYTDSPGRSLALATMIAAQRPLLLSTPSRMFEYAEGSDEPYWEPYSNQSVEGLAQRLAQMLAEVDAGIARIPVKLAHWDWPTAIQLLARRWI